MKNRLIRLCSASIAIVFLLSFGCNTSSTTMETPKTDTVIIEQMKFMPDTLTINKGDTVLFINKDIVEHDVTEINKAWTSGPLKMDESWKLVPEKSVDYYCSIHLVMKGKIMVK